jgi:TetR/AcrR family transcriptional repressor of nem operon
VFSPSVPPLDRFRRYSEFEYQQQVELKRQYGFALGCPLCTLGAEISTLEAGLRQVVQTIMAQCRNYFETAIRDAHAQGAIVAPDAATKAKSVYAFIEGLLTQARIQDDVNVLKEMDRGIWDILGVNSWEAAVT